MVRSLSFVQGKREWFWENKAFHLRRGWNFRMVWNYHISPGKVVSVHLLTDRNYVFKSSVILDFLYQLFTAWVEFRVVSFVPGKS